MTRGLYRRKKRGKDGKPHDTGAYVIDMRIKRVPELAGIQTRLFKTTGVFPGVRNADTIVREMKLMIKELILNRDASTLKRIQDNKLSIASAYGKWKIGQIHLAQGYEDQPVVKLWRGYYKTAPLKDATKANRLAIVSSLLAKGYLTEQHVINNLPEILPRIHRHYKSTKQAVAFNSIRSELKSFLLSGLGMDAESPFMRAVLRTPVMPVVERRAHNPFYTPYECVQFCNEVRKRRTLEKRELFAASVLFMCMHGLRPDEFEGRRFVVDTETEHLRILGTKNTNAKRVVPYFWEFGSDAPPKVDTMNRAFKRMKSKTRCRDFRRTFAIWCEAAGIPSSRIRAYMGHAAQSVTQTYQQTRPRQAMLDEDRNTIQKWFDAEIAKAPVEREQVAPPTAFRALQRALSPSLEKVRANIRKQDAKEAAYDAKHGR